MRYLLLFALLWGTLTVWAADPVPRTRILLLPVGVRSGVMDSKLFLRILEQQVEQKAERPVNLVIPNADDPRLEGLNLLETPSAAAALALGERFQAQYVVTLDVHFEDRVEKSILTVVGGALVTLDHVGERTRKVFDPLVFHSDMAASQPDALKRQREDLTALSAHDLADAIIVQTRARR